MSELAVNEEKVEAGDAENVLTNENASVDELMNATVGESDKEINTATSTGVDISNTFGANTRNIEIGMIVTLVVSLVIALVVFFAIAMKKKAPESRFMRYLREFLNFRKIWIAGILKFVYIFLAVALTIGSIVMMFFGGENVLAVVLAGLAMIIFGNIMLRLGFEMVMITIGLWENTRDIRGVLVKNEEIPVEEPKKEKKVKKVEIA